MLYQMLYDIKTKVNHTGRQTNIIGCMIQKLNLTTEKVLADCDAMGEAPESQTQSLGEILRHQVESRMYR